MQVNNQVTFKSWIAEFKGVDLPIGDYANDIARDKNFPDTEDLQKNFRLSDLPQCRHRNV